MENRETEVWKGKVNTDAVGRITLYYISNKTTHNFSVVCILFGLDIFYSRQLPIHKIYPEIIVWEVHHFQEIIMEFSNAAPSGSVNGFRRSRDYTNSVMACNIYLWWILTSYTSICYAYTHSVLYCL